MNAESRAVAALRADCAGPVIAAGGPEYAAACSGYNRFVEWSPEVIVRAQGPGDVRRGVTFAREEGLGVAVRSGGVGTAGAPAGTLLLDLRGLAAVDVQPGSVRVQAGAIWAEIDRQTAPFGRFAPGAQMSWVGAAGYALGGGFSWMGRRHGWASDNLLELELISASGEAVRVNAEEQPELFWGMRGAGSNFGVVTSLTLRSHPYTAVTAGEVFWRADDLGEVLAFWDRWTDSVPDELGSDLAVIAPMRGLFATPEPYLVGVRYCLLEDSPAGREAVAELRGFGRPLLDTSGPRSYLQLQGQGTEFQPPGMYQRFRMVYLDRLDEPVIAATVAAAKTLPLLSLISVHHYGGALGRVPEDASAMSHRDAKFNFMTAVRWWPFEDGSPALDWQTSLLAEVRGTNEDRAYVNYLFDEPDRVASAYSQAALARLTELKRRWDPDNLFAANQNIAPD